MRVIRRVCPPCARAALSRSPLRDAAGSVASPSSVARDDLRRSSSRGAGGCGSSSEEPESDRRVLHRARMAHACSSPLPVLQSNCSFGQPALDSRLCLQSLQAHLRCLLLPFRASSRSFLLSLSLCFLCFLCFFLWRWLLFSAASPPSSLPAPDPLRRLRFANTAAASSPSSSSPADTDAVAVSPSCSSEAGAAAASPCSS